MVRLQGLIARATARPISAHIIGVSNHSQTLIARLKGQMINPDQGIGAQIVEQGFHAVIEQGQPVLHARPAPALTDRGIKGIVHRRAKGSDIASAEPRNGLRFDQNFTHGKQIDPRQLARRTLGVGVKAANGLQRVAEHIQAHRLVSVGGEHINDAAANGKLAPRRNGRGPDIAINREIALEIRQQNLLAQNGAVAGLREDHARGHALHQGRDLGDDQPSGLALKGLGQLAEGRHTLGGNPCRGADTVIGQTVPRRKADDL